MYSAILFIFASSLLCGWVTAKFVLTRAVKKNRFDIPNDRSSHTIPTPTSGGIGIVLAVSVSNLAVIWHAQFPALAGLFIGLTLLATVGYIDDRKGVSRSARLAAQVIACTIAIIPTLNQGSTTWLMSLVIIFAATWLINLYNFMDGTDGLAATQTLIFAFGWLFLKLLCSEPTSELFVLFSLAGATTGFLILNFPPARIFMGDVGSTSIGLTIATIIVLSASNLGQLAASIILVSGFIVDATWTLLTRVYTRQKFWKAHRSHAYQIFAKQTGNHRYPLLAYLFTGIVIQWPLAFFAYHSNGFDWLFPLITAITMHTVACYYLKAGQAYTPKNQSSEKGTHC